MLTAIFVVVVVCQQLVVINRTQLDTLAAAYFLADRSLSMSYIDSFCPAFFRGPNLISLLLSNPNCFLRHFFVRQKGKYRFDRLLWRILPATRVFQRLIGSFSYVECCCRGWKSCRCACPLLREPNMTFFLTKNYAQMNSQLTLSCSVCLH